MSPIQFPEIDSEIDQIWLSYDSLNPVTALEILTALYFPSSEDPECDQTASNSYKTSSLWDRPYFSAVQKLWRKMIAFFS